MKYLIRKPDTFFSILNDDINTILKRNLDNIFPEYVFQKDMQGLAMPVDIEEYDDKFVLKAELPGVKKEDINIELNKSYVKIEAVKQTSTEENAHKYHKSEFRYGKYCRTMYFPSEADIEHAEASLHHGLLELKVPKMKTEEKEIKKLEIKE